MAPLTRRQTLQHTAPGGSVLALAGCTASNLPGRSGGESVPKPLTNDAYTASYTTAGRWLPDGLDGGRTGYAASQSHTAMSTPPAFVGRGTTHMAQQPRSSARTVSTSPMSSHLMTQRIRKATLQGSTPNLANSNWMCNLKRAVQSDSYSRTTHS
jgi:hypothetical protein